MTRLRLREVWALLAIVLLAINLRPAVVSVAPVIDSIRAETGLSDGAIGLLTAIPVLCFGVFSFLVPWLSQRAGLDRLAFLALGVLAIGIGLRLLAAEAALFAGTALAGVGIAIGNVLAPALVKQYFPKRTGWVTSLYTVALTGGAALAAGATIPVANAFGLDWRAALGVWGLLAIFGMLHLSPALVGGPGVTMSPRPRGSGVFRSPLAWAVVALLGFQSLVYYSITAWLPDYLVDQGMTAREAGWSLSMINILGTVSCLLVPIVAVRLRRQRLLAVGISLAALLGVLAFLLLPTAPSFGVALYGFAQGGSLSLALVLIVLRTPDPRTAADLSGMVQGVGYCIAALGPFTFGLLYEGSGRWTVPFSLLLVAVVLQGIAGWFAGRDAHVVQYPETERVHT